MGRIESVSVCFAVAVQVSLCIRIGGEVTETVAASDMVHNAPTSLQEAFISIASEAEDRSQAYL